MPRLDGPQWENFAWKRQRYDAYGESDGKIHYHAEGPEGMGIESPTGRDYGAVVSGRPGSWELSHVQEYSGLSDVADQIADALDFMGVTGAEEVSFENDTKKPTLESSDLVQNLYEKRPNFPRSFKTPKRAITVAETLIKRRDANIPVTPRPRQKGK